MRGGVDRCRRRNGHDRENLRDAHARLRKIPRGQNTPTTHCSVYGVGEKEIGAARRLRDAVGIR
jgi:hypothetical protein